MRSGAAPEGVGSHRCRPWLTGLKGTLWARRRLGGVDDPSWLPTSSRALEASVDGKAAVAGAHGGGLSGGGTTRDGGGSERLPQTRACSGRSGLGSSAGHTCPRRTPSVRPGLTSGVTPVPPPSRPKVPRPGSVGPARPRPGTRTAGCRRTVPAPRPSGWPTRPLTGEARPQRPARRARQEGARRASTGSRRAARSDG